MRTTRKNTLELEAGDIILDAGMRILLEAPIKTYEEGRAAWSGLVLNAEELCNKGHSSYDAYIARHLRGVWWQDRGSVAAQYDHWTIAGNDLAIWHLGTPWREVDELMEDGNAGGDIQVGKAYSRRFTHTKLPGRVLDIAAYAVRGDGTDPMPDADAPLTLQWQSSMTVCRDVDEPGSTEVWSDIEYSELPERFDKEFHYAMNAQAMARKLLEQFDPEHIGWDGKPEMEIS